MNGDMAVSQSQLLLILLGCLAFAGLSLLVAYRIYLDSRGSKKHKHDERER